MCAGSFCAKTRNLKWGVGGGVFAAILLGAIYFFFCRKRALCRPQEPRTARSRQVELTEQTGVPAKRTVQPIAIGMQKNSDLHAGAKVVVVGLKTDVDLNGRCVTVVRYNEELGRYMVKFEDGNERALKPENLDAVHDLSVCSLSGVREERENMMELQETKSTTSEDYTKGDVVYRMAAWTGKRGTIPKGDRGVVQGPASNGLYTRHFAVKFDSYPNNIDISMSKFSRAQPRGLSGLSENQKKFVFFAVYMTAVGIFCVIASLTA